MKVLLVPYSAGSLGKNKGCEKAPEEIIRKLNTFFTNEQNRKADFEVQEVLTDNSNMTLTFGAIKHAFMLFDKGIVLGGDHSITFPAVEASGCDGLIMFDAHADSMEGTDAITHEELIRALVDRKIMKPSNILIVGLRHWHETEMDYLRAKGIKFMSMKHIFETGIENVCDAIMEFGNQFKKLYVSIDIDVVDPAFAPGTGYIEPGGLTTRELIYFVQRLKLLKNLAFVDIVEVNPETDIKEITVSLAAKILNELC